MNLRYLLPNTRLFLRNNIGRYSVLGTRRSDLAFSPDCDLCIEGFPRSANTYGVLLIEQFATRPLKIAHHLHMPAQLKKAVHHGIPAILLIREPAAAIGSLLLREQKVSPWSALYWYNSFHTELLPYRDRLIIWEFRDLIEQPRTCIQQLAQHTSLVAADRHPQLDNTAIFAEIDRLDAVAKKGAALAVVNSRPNAQKKAQKATVLEALRAQPHYAHMLHRAEDLYAQFTQRGG